jgi:hypothetical protein
MKHLLLHYQDVVVHVEQLVPLLHPAHENIPQQDLLRRSDLPLHHEVKVTKVQSVPGNKFKQHILRPNVLVVGQLCLIIFQIVWNVVYRQPTTTAVYIAMLQSIGSVPLTKQTGTLPAGELELCIDVLSVSTMIKVSLLKIELVFSKSLIPFLTLYHFRVV